jgi:Holliday junction resolvase RusA-like endonuclease
VGTELKQLTVQINNKHKRCLVEPARALLSACTIGNLLLQIKAILSESEWQTWLQDCCSFSEASAQTYMVIAARNSFIFAPQKALPQIGGVLSERQVENNDKVVEKKEVNEVVVSSVLVVEKVETERQEAPGSVFVIEKTEALSGELTAKLITPEEASNSVAITKADFPEFLAKQIEAMTEPGEDNGLKSVTEKEETTKRKTKKKKVEKKSNSIVFYIPGNVVPKARPRVTSKGTYLPRQYRQWRNMAEVEIYRQILDMNLSEKLPIKKAAISLSFCGKHRTNSDLDNMAGACLDALTLNGAGVLKDDRLSCIPKLSVEYVAGEGETGVWITIESID